LALPICFLLVESRAGHDLSDLADRIPVTTDWKF
jgi:hypothetical protein